MVGRASGVIEGAHGSGAAGVEKVLPDNIALLTKFLMK
jgi:hypothetical protein